MDFQRGMVIIYHDINHEARSREMLQCIEQICEQCFYVSYIEPQYPHKAQFIPSSSGKLRYLKFIQKAISSIRSLKPDLVLLHDNLAAPVLRWLVKKRIKARIIYDSSEFYADRNPTNFKEKIARYTIAMERRYIKMADVVIAANIERAEYMQKYFSLAELPCVFDNMHRIDDEMNPELYEKKYENIFGNNKFIIVYAGGIAKERRTFELVRAVCELDEKPCYLLIFGRADLGEKENIDAYLTRQKKDCVNYQGYITRAELKYVLNHSHISVSAFSQNNINNIFCASGKIYESLFEGVPILTSENPTLKRICVEHGVGVSNDDFKAGIIYLYDHYEEYQRNVVKYISGLDFDNRINSLAKAIQRRLKYL